ncbi:MAG: O-methyltransferase [Chrysiogenetes bacterium]|nr:O-methyltransferase [Chrysiogenetes bacterium]
MSTYSSPTKPGVEKYLDGLRPKPDAVLKKMIAHAEKDDVPVVSPDVGEMLYLLTRANKPARIVECGTAIGMSALHFARGLKDAKVKGVVDTCDVSEERHAQAAAYMKQAGLSRYVNFRTVGALEYLRNNRAPIDVLFLDAVKEEYADYVRAALPKMKKGALIIADNTLWHGYVSGVRKPKGKFWQESTKALSAFNKFFVNHPKLYARIFPIGDGLGVGTVR